MRKVLVIAPEFPPAIGGIENYASNFVAMYREKGWGVEVLTRSGNGQVTLPGGGQSNPVLEEEFVRDKDRILGLVPKFDLVHAMTATYGWLGKFCCPMVTSVHGKDLLAPSPRYGWNLKQRLRVPKGDHLNFLIDRAVSGARIKEGLAKCFLLLPNSNHVKSLLPAKCRTQAQCLVVNPGIPETLIDGLPSKLSPFDPGTKLRLLTVCRLDEPRKGVDKVMHALKDVAGQLDFHYTVVGSGSRLEELKDLANQLGLRETVRFTGRVSQEELEKYYREADLFVLTSASSKDNCEGFGIVYLEANARGVPVLAARLGGVPDAVQDGVSGMLIESAEIVSIRRAIEIIATGKKRFDPADCIGHAKSFTWEQVTSKYFERLNEQFFSANGRDSQKKDS
jgi:glycosyltransferase involved in cell wall biosynthesis